MKCGSKLVCWCVSAMALTNVAYGAVEWKAGEKVTVSDAGETVVTDADYAAANACSRITISEGATLVFNTTLPPTTDLRGTGTFIKRGDACWNVTTAQGNFGGDYIVEGGEFTNAVSHATGLHYWTGGETDLSVCKGFYVRSGATFVNAIDAGGALGQRVLHIAGTGFHGKGAVVNAYAAGSYNGVVTRLMLDDDALWDESLTYMFIAAYGSARSRVDLNGKTLTLAGPNTFLCNGELVGGGKLIKNGGCLILRDRFTASDPETVIELINNASIQTYDTTDTPGGNHYSQLKIADGCDSAFYHAHQGDRACTVSAEHNNWAGPVYVGEGSLLRAYPNASNSATNMWISGPISGPGAVNLMWSDGAAGNMYITSSNNTFSGGCTISYPLAAKRLAGQRRAFHFAYSNSLPDYKTVYVKRGTLPLKPTPEVDQGWSLASIERLNREATFDSDWVAPAVIDASDEPDKTLTVSASDVAAEPSDAPVILAAQEGSALVVQAPMTRPLVPLTLTNAPVKVVGPGVVALTNTAIGARKGGTLTIDGATPQMELPIILNDSCNVSHWVLTNCVLTVGTVDWTYEPQSGSEHDSIMLGMSEGRWGAFTIEAGSVVTSRVHLAGGSSAFGRLRQTGGVFVSPSSSGDSGTNVLGVTHGSAYGFRVGESGAASFELEGGTCTVIGTTSVGGNVRAPSVFRQTGGTFTTLDHPLAVAKRDGWLNIGMSGTDSRTAFVVEGGTSYVNGTILVRGGNGAFDHVSIGAARRRRHSFAGRA